jgi:hypothetical protein
MRFPLLAILLLLPMWANAQAKTPPAGGPERTAIINALRVPVQKELKTAVQFKVDHLRVQSNWAFIGGYPQAKKGKIDWNKTRYKVAIDEGAFDEGVFALLRKKNGKWTVVKYVIGATDVPWVEWPQKYGAPKAIFPG